MNKLEISVQHVHVENFIECADNMALNIRCVEEGEYTDRFEIEYMYAHELFYFGQAYGLTVGFKVSRENLNKVYNVS